MLSLRSFRTGEVLYALGNIRNAQKNFDESLRYYLRALRIFNATDELGTSIAKANYKVGVHFMRMGDWKNAGYSFLFNWRINCTIRLTDLSVIISRKRSSSTAT